jgi:hypothetical protein
MTTEDASIESISSFAGEPYSADRGRMVRMILLCGSLVSVLFYGLVFVASSYLRHVPIDAAVSFWSNDFPRPLPVSAYPSPAGNHFFGDFLVPFRLAQQTSPYLATDYVPFGYLPMSAVLLGPLTLLGYWWALLVFLVVSITLLMFCIWRAFPGDDKSLPVLLIALVLLSGPFVNAVDRGNVGLLMVSIMCLGVLAELSGRRVLSGMCFGVAAAMKLYPAFLGAVFVNRKRLKTMTTMATTSILCVVIPLMVYEGGWGQNLIAMKDQFVGSSNFAHAERIHAFNNSFFALFHAMAMSQTSVVHGLGRLLVEHYYAVVAAVALLSLTVASHPRVPTFSKFICCSVTMAFAPNIVGSYVLLIMLAPLMLGCTAVSRADEASSRTTLLQLALLVLILVPKGLPFPNPLAEWSQAESTFASVLNPCFGFLLLISSLVEFVRVSIPRTKSPGGSQPPTSLFGEGMNIH